MKLRLLAAALLICVAAFTASAASMIGIDPPSSVIVYAGGLEWVYAAPCAPTNGCGTITLHHGFRFPTQLEWTSSFSDLSQMYALFTTPSEKCAAPYFSDQWDHCDFADFESGYVYGSPFAPNESYRSNTYSETFLVREGGEIPEPASYFLVAAGLSAVALIRRKRASAR
ncbi:MAG: hypothetical protein KatS3mg005_2378 [Bryobacteraceae bacterium]|nr:MAG: hypothetical protein KatS3mg005_2378 [Bryobacteraceae bacterium]